MDRDAHSAIPSTLRPPSPTPWSVSNIRYPLPQTSVTAASVTPQRHVDHQLSFDDYGPDENTPPAYAGPRRSDGLVSSNIDDRFPAYAGTSYDFNTTTTVSEAGYGRCAVPPQRVDLLLRKFKLDAEDRGIVHEYNKVWLPLIYLPLLKVTNLTV